MGEPGNIKKLNLPECKIQLSRYRPAEDLAFFVEHYWIVTWDFRAQEPYLVEILPHPRVHLVITQDNSSVFGVVKGTFSYLYERAGRVFGVRFRPGAFYPFVQMPIAQFTDTSIRLVDTFGVESVTLEESLLEGLDEATMIEHVEHFLRERLPEQDKNVEMLHHIFDNILANREITRVDDVVYHLNLSKRTLQRLFHHYVGVSPKWVIKHYRLHEVAQRLAQNDVVNWAQLALDLGYCDQAHFIKDFRTFVGKSPAEYAKTVGTGSYRSPDCVLLHKAKR